METKGLKIILLLFLAISIILFNGIPASAALITDIRFWSAPDHTRVVLDLTEPVQYESSSSEKPLQYQLELKASKLLTKKRNVKVNDPYLSKIVLSDPGKERVKLIFHQRKPLNVNIFSLKPYQDKPHRLVIDLVDLTQERKEEAERQRKKEVKPKGAKIIVIDPGHGGEDPGAKGPGKTMEKDIVLRVGAKLVRQFDQETEIQAFLTRKGDYFIPLEQRIRIARQYGADLFVSLHTDGSFNPQARGSSVYCLSLSGATDQAAKILADKENMSNILGGAVSKPVTVSKDPHLNQILLDLMQNNSMRESVRFADLVLDDIKRITHIKYPSYRQANFVVLRAPDIPSVLFEMSYISNREDERLLNGIDFQNQVAKMLFGTITKFFGQ